MAISTADAPTSNSFSKYHPHPESLPAHLANKKVHHQRQVCYSIPPVLRVLQCLFCRFPKHLLRIVQYSNTQAKTTCIAKPNADRVGVCAAYTN